MAIDLAIIEHVKNQVIDLIRKLLGEICVQFFIEIGVLELSVCLKDIVFRVSKTTPEPLSAGLIIIALFWDRFFNASFSDEVRLGLRLGRTGNLLAATYSRTPL